MIREFKEQWEKDYVRKTTETLEAQVARRRSAAEQNAQREDIDETIGEGGGDEEEDGESEDDNEDGHGSGGASKRPGTRRRKLIRFYFRTGAVFRKLQTTVVTLLLSAKLGDMSTARKF
jgi:hypothetical protein